MRTRLARIVLPVFLVFALSSVGLSDDRTVIHPGFNLFSPQQDIELGKKASTQVPRQFAILNNKRVDQYLQRLGTRLAAHAPGYKYPYQYRCIDSETINAFALPGGFVYINRGVIENADDEAQLAAVMAHE
ncbi:MAG TPA: M48 family metalloprotease, partial [Candidatus Acidoferrales bacterium]|nr:M48 family metalloprotease [Candidatus Acidoferrales bacterium]